MPPLAKRAQKSTQTRLRLFLVADDTILVRQRTTLQHDEVQLHSRIIGSTAHTYDVGPRNTGPAQV